MASIPLSVWYRRWRGETRALPQSQAQGAAVVQNQFVPIQAFIALFSGKPAGDLDCLRWALTRIEQGEAISCTSCGQALAAIGDGHAPECELFSQASEVLEGGRDAEQRRLLFEQNRLDEKKVRIAHKLDALGARNE